MKKYTFLLAAVMALFTFAPAVAAPLFGDVPEEHWARDAVANLAAKGLVEGYPDGTFKGARAATRYEMAMVVARFLAKNDQEHATFATKADLEDLRRLVNQLKNELDALGVRVTNLEDSVSKLDKRVTELERITFYGEIDTFFVTQGFNQDDEVNPQIHVGGFNNYQPWQRDTIGTDGRLIGITYNDEFNDLTNNSMTFTNSSTFAPYMNHTYSQMVGQVSGATMSPYQHGTFGVVDYRNGRPLTNGTGLSIRAIFGINAKVSDDIDAGLELAAYSSIGDSVVNSYYGASAPYMSNPFTASNRADTLEFNAMSLGSSRANGNSPWTRMTLDNFWVKHKPSGIKLVAGSFGELNMDGILYAGQPNPNVNGPKYLNNYGARVFGTANFLSDMDWEVFYTELADGDPYRHGFSRNHYSADNSLLGVSHLNGSDYNTYAYGFSLGWRFEGGNFKLGYLTAQNDTIASVEGYHTTNGIFTLGSMLTDTMTPYGLSASNPFGWVNPNGYFYGQLAGGDTVGGNIVNGNWMNKSPIFTAIGVHSADGNWGGYGAQSTTNWSAHFDYTWEGNTPVRVMAEYASSEWTPNKESGFSESGSAVRAGLGVTLFKGAFDLDVEYKSVEADYDPFTLRYPTGMNAMWRFPQMSYFPNMYQLHDSDVFPNNRDGWNFKAAYRFNDDRGKVWASFEHYEQKTTSVYDQRYYAGSVSGNLVGTVLIPDSLVFGYTPGFIDPVFTPYAMGNYYMWNVGNPEDIQHWGAPIEDCKGKASKWMVGADYKFPDSNIVIDASYYSQNFKRHSDLEIGQIVNLGDGDWSVGVAPSANHIDLDLTGFHVGLSYPFNERFTGKIGYDYSEIRGHYDPNNIYALYASHYNTKDFTNIDTTQSIPYIGFDYKISKNTEWGLNLQFFSTSDKIGSELSPRVRDVGQSAVAEDTQVSNLNPFSWSGLQVMTEFKVKF